MKYILIILVFVGYGMTAQAQYPNENLVLNPSFEKYNTCPVNYSYNDFFGAAPYGIVYSPYFNLFPVLQDWVSPSSVGTPDYFNVCAPFSVSNSNGGFNLGVQVPHNYVGYEYPRTGNAYAGFFAANVMTIGGANTYIMEDTGLGRGLVIANSNMLESENLETKLSMPMKANHHYKVHFYVNLASYEAYDSLSNTIAIDQLGAYFSKTQVNDFSAEYLTDTPQIKSTPGYFISDTFNWVRIEGIYTATGNEQWLTLGRFYDSTSFNVEHLNILDTVYNPANPSAYLNENLSYYYVDDVCVLDLDSPITTHSDTLLCTSSFPYEASVKYHPDSSGSPDSIQYTWNTGQKTAAISVNDTGTYWVTTMGECSIFVDTIHLGYHSFLPLNIGNDTNYCPGQTAVLTANSPYSSYQWNTGDTTPSINVTISGIYTLKVTDTCQVQIDSIALTFNPTPPPSGDSIICQGVIAPIIRVAGDSVLWYTSVNAVGSSVQPPIQTDSPGVVTLYVSQTGTCGESVISPIRISINPLPQIFLPADTILCTGSSLQISTGEQGIQQYLWNTGDTTCCIMASTSGTYKVTGTGFCGTTTDTVNVTVENCNNCLWAPNAFTPNNDGNNDRFVVVNNCPVLSYQIIIVNRWGQTVFESFNINQSWDGTYNGIPADMGTYYYMITASPNLEGGKQIEMKGDITLVR